MRKNRNNISCIKKSSTGGDSSSNVSYVSCVIDDILNSTSADDASTGLLVNLNENVLVAYCSLVQVLTASVGTEDRDFKSGVVDSGASHHMSGCQELFESLTEKYVSLTVADRTLPTRARLGIFRDNKLGLKKGLYHPSLQKFHQI